MRHVRTVLALACIHLAPAAAAAQAVTTSHFTAGAVTVFAPDWSPALAIGATRARGGGALGGELGVVQPHGERQSRLAIATVTGGFQPSREAGGTRFQPFAYTGAVLTGAATGWVAGAGTNYWAGERLGLRFDARLMRPFKGEGGAVMLQVGVTHRQQRRPHSRDGV